MSSNKETQIIKRTERQFSELRRTFQRKSRLYGPQSEYIRALFDLVTDHGKYPIILRNGEDVWRYHLTIEILAKYLRYISMLVRKRSSRAEPLTDSLFDCSVYSAMLGSRLTTENLRRENDRKSSKEDI